jgi:hypothetical protein
LKPNFLFTSSVLFTLLFSSCQQQTFCPPATGTPDFLTIPPGEIIPPTPGSSSVLIELDGKTLQVDRVIKGPLCNDTWSGVIYVTCDVQVYAWEEQPDFLKNCALTIEPGTIVYVAAHNNAPYYNGCSCHTGDITGQ